MTMSFRNLLMSAACVLLSACGTQATDVAGTDAKSHALSDYSVIADHFAFSDEEKGGDASNLECMAIRTKIQAAKVTLKASSEWINVKGTEAWAALKSERDAFEDNHCKFDTDDQSSTCNEAKTKLKNAWETLTETPEWKVLADTDTYKGLQSNYNKAKEMNCYK